MPTRHRTTKSEPTKSPRLQSLVDQIEKKYGAGSIMQLGRDKPIAKVPVISTGILSLDKALGVGGFPRGRVVELFGPESAGKTTIALHVIAEAQKAGGSAAFVDAEHALDLAYASNLGVNCNDLFLSQPDNGEQALEIVDMLTASGQIAIIVIDSVAALVPLKELEGDMGDSHMGLHARLMSQACRKLSGICSKSNTCIVFLNQLRMKIGIVFGNPETTTGGNALKFYASVRLDIRRIGAVKEDTTFIGNRTRVRVVKNKLASPFKDTEFDIIYGKGVSKINDLIEVGTDAGVIKKSGSWYSYQDERLGQGKDNTRIFLESNPDLLTKLKKEVRGEVNI